MNTDLRNLRDHPMVKTWIANYQKRSGFSGFKDCKGCGFPHHNNIICYHASFGEFTMGNHVYFVDINNVEYFVKFMPDRAPIGSFHWKNDIYFRRTEKSEVEVTFYDQYNNCPQKRVWKISDLEWKSIISNLDSTLT